MIFFFTHLNVFELFLILQELAARAAAASDSKSSSKEKKKVGSKDKENEGGFDLGLCIMGSSIQKPNPKKR